MHDYVYARNKVTPYETLPPKVLNQIFGIEAKPIYIKLKHMNCKYIYLWGMEASDWSISHQKKKIFCDKVVMKN